MLALFCQKEGYKVIV